MRRRAFLFVPGSACTAHAYCGDTLEECKADLLECHILPTLDMMQRSHIIRSQVQNMGKCMIVRPYSPVLLNQGTLLWPDVLLQRQRSELTAKALKKKWKDVEPKEAHTQSDGWHGTWGFQ